MQPEQEGVVSWDSLGAFSRLAKNLSHAGTTATSDEKSHACAHHAAYMPLPSGR